ncbi:MAG TPA: hypothetical protein VNM48_11775, partial [Chloroflexota bacterium]|nr:hypothetical protein [Chloroflexota bacterium]
QPGYMTWLGWWISRPAAMGEYVGVYQRNWTDASYKTYCTPLRDPYPVEVKAGTKIKQTLAIQLTGDLGRVRLPSLTSPTAVRVTIGSHPTTLLPPIGLGVAAHGLPLSQVEIGALKRLRLAHLRVTLELTRPEWEQRLDDAAAQAAALGVALEIEAICGDSGAGIDGLAAALASHVKHAPIARVLVFPKMGVVTTEPVMRRSREVFRAARLDVPLGGGTRADFVNANRAELPIDEMDLIGYAINPQVHAFDNASLVETLPGQRATVENARRIAGGKPVTVGPITLRQRLNPAATAAEPQVASDELPSRVDPRQLSSFCAGWTLGSIRHLAAAGAAALTYFETTGWLGVMERADGGQSHPRFPSEPGMLFPVYHVFAAIGDLLATRNRVELLPVEISAPRTVEALALQAGDQRIALVANLLDAAQRVEVAGNKALELEPHEVRVLNLTIGDTS